MTLSFRFLSTSMIAVVCALSGKAVLAASSMDFMDATTTVSSSVITATSSSTVVRSSVSSTPLTTDFMVQIDDLSHAGFTNPRRLLPAGGRFDEPLRYFRVNEHLSVQESARDCADCGDLVMVYVTRAMPTSTPVWVVRSNPLIQPMGGRLQLRWFAANRVITVIAPGSEERVRALGSWLRERAILGKNN